MSRIIDTIEAATILRDAGCPPTPEQLANALEAAMAEREPQDAAP